MAVGILKSAVVARFLGPANRGIYGLVCALPDLLSGLGNLGSGPAVYYFVAKRQRDLQSVVGAVLVFCLANGIVLAVVTYVIIHLPSLFAEERWALHAYQPLMLVSLPLLLAALLGQRLLNANGRMRTLSVVTVVGPTAQFLCFLLFLRLRATPLSAAIWAWLLSTAATALVSFVLLRKDGAYPPRLDTSLLREGLQYGLSNYVAQCCEFAMFRLDYLFVAQLLEPAALGVYAIATQMAEMLRMLPQAVLNPFIPLLFGLEERDSVRFTPVVTRMTTGIMAVACVGAALIGRPVIRLVYGEAYLMSYVPFVLLLPGIAGLSLYCFIRFDLYGRNKGREVSQRAAVALVVNVVGNAVAIPCWGIAGAAVTSSVSYLLVMVLTARLYYQTSGNTLRDLFVPRPEELMRIAQAIATRAWKRPKGGMGGTTRKESGYC